MASHSISTTAPARRVFLAAALALAASPGVASSSFGVDPMTLACAKYRDRLNIDVDERSPSACDIYDAYFDLVCRELEAAIPTTQAGVLAALSLIAEEQASEGEIWTHHARMLENCIAALGSLT